MVRRFTTRWLSPLLSAVILFAALFPTVLPTNASILNLVRTRDLRLMANTYLQYVTMLYAYPTDFPVQIAVGGPAPTPAQPAASTGLDAAKLGLADQPYTQDFLYGVGYGWNGSSPLTILFRASSDGSLVQPLQVSPEQTSYTVSSGSDGNVYGVEYDLNTAYGSMFQITEDGVVHTLGASTGDMPITLFRGIDGELYGYGWSLSSSSILGSFVYRLTAAGQLQILHSFTGSMIGYCQLVGQAADGDLFGYVQPDQTTDINSGYVFRLTPDGSTYQIIHSFTSASPEGELVTGLVDGKNGYLYGATTVGSVTDQGSEFKVAYDGSSFEWNGSGGGYGVPTVEATDHNVYGVNSYNDEIDLITPDLQAIPVGATLGTSYPYAMVQGPDGVFYGVSDSFYGDTSASGFFRLDMGLPPANNTPKTQVGWVNVDDALSLWDYDPISGGFAQNTYGPLYGATAVSTATAPDGTSRMLWDNPDGSAYIWTVDNATGWLDSHTAGPFSGLTAKSLCVSPDGITHVLWTGSNGVASIWNYDPITGAYTQHTYGPYPNWSASAIADGIDGRTRILWNSTAGVASVWSVDDTFGVFSQNTFGPYPGWTATALAASPTTTHVLWTNTGGAASLWSYDTVSGNFTQNTFGPFPNWSAVGLSDGGNGVTQLLWDSAGGAASIWSLPAGGGFSQYTYGPYPDWTADFVSSTP
ncbi:MAG: choice-of-anchor tandem repeat GloVer-containing protein [Capsulimonadaceae bacterium]